MINKRPYQQCLRCVMDTTDPEIVFDEEGRCNHCTACLNRIKAAEKSDQFSKKNLDKLVAKIKAAGRGKEYDCVLGLSGGIDSSYAAYLLKKMGLRVLLVHMDNGWNAEEAVLNIKNIAQLLHFDYESYVLDWQEFRDLQLSFLKASVIEADTPTDIAILGALHQIAARYNVQYIISGGNNATEGILPRLWHYNAKDTTYLKAIHKKYGSRRLKKFPHFGYLQEMYYKFVKGISMVYILNYFDYNKQEAMQVLKDELNWQYYGGKHYESRYTKFIQSYLLPVKFNLDYRKATFSSQICAGKLTRPQALEQLKQPTFREAEIRADKEFVSKKLAISKDELEAIIASPPKTYRDYPNDEKKLNIVYNTYRKFFGK